jgi:hypothetical protein
MRLSILALTGWLAICWAAPVQAQKSASPAELLPAKVIAYAELNKPGTVAKEMRELFKGSVLYDLPDSFAKLEAKHGGDVHNQWATMAPKMFGLMIAPEVVNEAGKIQGAAVAFLGMKIGKVIEDGPPEADYVVIVQPGTSNAPTFLMRMLMTMAPVKVKATVEDVKIYQPYRTVYKFGKGKPGDPPPKPEMREDGPAFAMMKGYIFLGSPNAIKDCIQRAHGKGDGESLAKSQSFKDARKKFGNEPGLFAFGDMTAMMAFMKEMTKGSPPDVAQFMDEYSKFINAKAFRSWAVGLSMNKGTLHIQEYVQLNPQEKSSLLEIYPNKAVNTDILHFAPKDSILAFAISNADGAARWEKLITALDAMVPAKAFGGQKLSEHIQDVEKQLGVKLGPDIFGKTTNIAFAMGNPLMAPVKVTKIEGPGFTSMRSEPEVPMVLILEATDAKTAQTMKELIVKACELAAMKKQEPTSQKIKGQTVYTLKIKPHETINYGLVENTLVVGTYAEGVGQALADGLAKKGLAADPKAMAQIKAFKDPIAVTAVKPGMLIGGLLITSYSYSGKSADVEPKKAIDGGGKDVPKQKEQPKEPKTTVTIQKDPPEVAKLKKELMKILDHEPWLIVGTMRGDDYLLQECKSPGWDKFVPKMVNFAVEKLLEERMGSGKKILPKDEADRVPEIKKAPDKIELKQVDPIPPAGIKIEIEIKKNN